MATQILDGAIPSPYSRSVGALSTLSSSMGSRTLELGLDVIDPDLDDVCHGAVVRSLLVSPDVGTYHGPVGADAHPAPGDSLILVLRRSQIGPANQVTASRTSG